MASLANVAWFGSLINMAWYNLRVAPSFNRRASGCLQIDLLRDAYPSGGKYYRLATVDINFPGRSSSVMP